MSVFSNAAAVAKANAEAYKRGLLELLGSRNPLEVLAELPSAIEGLTSGLSDTDARRPERPGKWSILQVVQHLIDSETVYGYRVRLIVANPKVEIIGYDQDAWAARLHYLQESLVEAIPELRVMRARNLRFVRHLSEEEMDYFGLHSERGPESIRDLVRLLAGHDLLHRAQIARIRDGLGLG